MCVRERARAPDISEANGDVFARFLIESIVPFDLIVHLQSTAHSGRPQNTHKAQPLMQCETAFRVESVARRRLFVS